MKYQNKKIIIFMIIFNTFLFFLTNCGDENKNVKLKLNLSNNLTALNQTCTITNEQNLSVR
jgi:hypothetical protein